MNWTTDEQTFINAEALVLIWRELAQFQSDKASLGVPENGETRSFLARILAHQKLGDKLSHDFNLLSISDNT
jgi:hypothetical protein